MFSNQHFFDFAKTGIVPPLAFSDKRMSHIFNENGMTPLHILSKVNIASVDHNDFFLVQDKQRLSTPAHCFCNDFPVAVENFNQIINSPNVNFTKDILGRTFLHCISIRPESYEILGSIPSKYYNKLFDPDNSGVTPIEMILTILSYDTSPRLSFGYQASTVKIRKDSDKYKLIQKKLRNIFKKEFPWYDFPTTEITIGFLDDFKKTKPSSIIIGIIE